jgi:alpha-tubulin suppressor-like RCC1 family protein
VFPAGVHTCALRRDGSVLCWGSNRRGQLGYGSVGPLVVALALAPVDLGSLP